MRILLVNPNTAESPVFKVPPFLPLASLHLASVLELNGDEVRIVDRNVTGEGVEQVIQDFKPELLGISVLTGPCILDALHVSRACKAIAPECVVVWGGIHPTLDPEVTLSEPSIDFVVRGEGEDTLKDLVTALERGGDIGQVQGMSFRKDEGIYHTPRRPLIEDLGTLPYPTWHLVDVTPYAFLRSGRKFFTMHTSRGCTYNCAFCYNWPFNQRRWRGLSASRIMEQIRYLVAEYGVGYIEFFEDNFPLNQQRLREICNQLIKEDLGLKWSCEARIGTLGRDMLTKMKQAGCQSISFGVESGSPRILEMLCKDITVQQTIDTFKLCWEVGIRPDAFIMVGLPHETEADLEMTLKLVDAIRPGRAGFLVYRPYPGTELYQMCVAEGRLEPPRDLETWARISDYHTPEFNVGDLRDEVLERLIVNSTIYRERKAVFREIGSSQTG